MGIKKYSIMHQTTYSYTHPVSISYHIAHCEPISNNIQSCESFRIEVNPISEDMDRGIDYYGNQVHRFSVQKMHQELIVETHSIVNVQVTAPDISNLTMSCADVRNFMEEALTPELLHVKEFQYPTEITPTFVELKNFIQPIFRDDRPIQDALMELLDIFKDDFSFDPNATDVSTPISEVLKYKKGVCQDYAHLMIAALRCLGFSAKYVSGYILSFPEEGMPRLEGADASHAWVAIYLPEIGWVELDPTNRLICSHEHIRVAYGRDYSDVSMLKGAMTGGGKHTVSVAVTVKPAQ
ncbi:transglutaminase family protein [Akkermansiaceae bacterium]|nr:transglutaminase family protein [Akkermansiaceae bacterium]